MEELVSEGAVGEFACCLFDAEGNGRKEWEFLLTAGYPNSVQHYKDMVKEGYPVIGVGNLATLPAIRAALQGKIVNILVTDIYAAAELDENGLHSEQQRKVMFHAATSDLAELINDVRHRPLSESEFLKRLEEGFVELRTWGPLAGWTSGILQEELDTWERELREAWTDGLKHPGRSTL
jgi:hypothetical protein